jgi:hypothetical protein
MAGSAVKAYLVAYNAFQAVGWAVCLYQVAHTLSTGGSVVDAYRAGAPAAGEGRLQIGWRAPLLFRHCKA